MIENNDKTLEIISEEEIGIIAENGKFGIKLKEEHNQKTK